MESPQDRRFEERILASRPARTPADRRPDCPPLEDWGLYEAGLLPDTRALELTEHASTCDACGYLLADLRQDAAGLSQPESAIELESGTDRWKQQLLARIAEPIQVRASRRFQLAWFRAPWLQPAWIGATAVFAVVVLGIWWIRDSRSPAAAIGQLARAYSQERPFEMRIPEAAHRSFVRGVVPAGSLQGITDQIGGKLEEQPNNVAWLRAHALADLLQGNHRHALEDLRMAQNVEPDNPDIWGDFGIAYLARADAESRPDDLVPAIDFLSRAIAKRPVDVVFRFNRALAYERLGDAQMALDDWSRFLELESSGGWADEARRHRAVQEQKLSDRKGKASVEPEAEGAILPVAAQGFRDTGTLQVANVARALQERHGDPWMHDLLAVPNAVNNAAMETVQAATHATTTGHDQDALELWSRAENQFRNVGNVPGLLFASLERVYSMLRLADPDRCLALADASLPEVRLRRYKWIEAQLSVTRGSCLAQRGLSDLQYETSLRAAETAGQAGYRISQLYALGLAASALRQMGSYREAMKLDAEGVGLYWAGEGDRSRAYQFYYGLASDASALHYSEAAAALMAQAVGLAELGPNRSVEAMVRARHAEILTENRVMLEAGREFQRAGALFETLGRSRDVQYYQAYADLSHARFDAQESRLTEGFQKLDNMTSVLPSIKNTVVEAKFWHVKSDLYTRSGDFVESEKSLRRVLDLSTGADDSAELAREASDAVGILSDRLRERGDTEGALRLWSEYHPSFRTLGDSSQTLKLMFAALPSGPAVWVSGAGSVRFYRLPVTSDRLARLAREFVRLLAGQSELERVRSVGRELYAALIAPLEDSMAGVGSLWISADGPLAEVPFGALVAGKDQWLASQYRIAYSPPLRGVARVTAPGVTRGSRLLAVASGDGGKILNFSLAPIPSVAADLKSAAGAFANYGVLSGTGATGPALLQALPRAEVFHFSGHAIVTASDAALVLARDPRDGDQTGLTWASKIPAAALNSVRLAMLAACGTGKPRSEDDEPSSTMARAFLRAGVPEVIASRWDADSAATSYLVQDFYRRLGHGDAAEQALAAAVGNLREQSAFAHPYYWAAFDDFRL